MTSNNPVTYINISDKYGDAVEVTIDDYIELNPDGDFTADADGIYEDDELIARPLDNDDDDQVDDDVPAETLYQPVDDRLGDSEPTTASQIIELVSDWWELPGWRFDIESSYEDIRVYAYLENEEEDEENDSRYFSEWVEITRELYYMVIARAVHDKTEDE